MFAAMQRGGRGRGHVPKGRSSESRREKPVKIKEPMASQNRRTPGARNFAQEQRNITAPPDSKTDKATNSIPRTSSRETTATGSSQDRWNVLKKAHDREHADAIAKGLIADPDKPRQLDEAIKPTGTCQDMCPEYERVGRIVQKDVWKEEWDPARLPEKVVDEKRMVKKFRRAAAGLEEQLPSDLRPPPILQKTVDYLFNNLINEKPALRSIHHFVWDRTRAIRNDFSIQQLTRLPDVRIAIDCYERIARFHILSLHQLAQSDKPYDTYDAYQEREQLDRTFLSLMQYYDDNRHIYQAPNEAEFRAYCILFQIQDPDLDFGDTLQALPSNISQDPRVRTAFELYVAAANVRVSQNVLKLRRSCLTVEANWARFWSLVQSTSTSYLMGCVAEIYFTVIRKTALVELCRAYYRGGKVKVEDWTLNKLVDTLAFDDESEAQTFCDQHGFTLAEGEDGASYLDLTSVRGTQGPDPLSNTSHQSFSHKLVETKRYGRTFSAIINSMTVQEAQDSGLVEESEDETGADEAVASDSLFIPAIEQINHGQVSRAASIFEGHQDQESIHDRTEQMKNPETKAIGTANEYQAVQNPFSFPKVSDQSNNRINGDLSTPLNNPFAPSTPLDGNFGTSKSTATLSNFGKPSQLLNSGSSITTTSSGFETPSPTLSSSSNNLTSGITAFSSAFPPSNPTEQSLSHDSTKQAPPLLTSPFTTNKPTEREEMKETTTMPSSTMDPPAFPSTGRDKPAMSTFKHFNPFSPTEMSRATGSSSTIVNPFAKTTASPAGDSSQRHSNGTASVPASTPVITPHNETEKPSFSSLATQTQVIPTQEWRHQPFPSTDPLHGSEKIEGSSPIRAQSPGSSTGSPHQSQPSTQGIFEASKVAHPGSVNLPTAQPANTLFNPLEASIGVDAPKKQPKSNEQPAPSAATQVLGSPSSASPTVFRASPTVFRASPVYQNKHQPTRPSPLSHVTTFPKDTSPSLELPSEAIEAQRLQLSTRDQMSSTSAIRSPVASPSDINTRVNVLDALTYQVLLDENTGLMSQFVEFISDREVERALEQFKAEECARKAAEIRRVYLARKFGRLWRENSWKRRLANRGRELRKKKIRELTTQNERKRLLTTENRGQRALGRGGTENTLKRKHPQAPSGHTGSLLGDSELDAVEDTTKRKKYRSEPSVSNSISMSTTSPLGDPLMFEHIRDPATLIQPRGRARAQTTPTLQQDLRTPAAHVAEDGVAASSSVPGNPTSAGNSRHSPSEQGSTTQSSYFRLRAMGIIPNTNPNRKRIRQSSTTSPISNTVLHDAEEMQDSEPERKKLQVQHDLHPLGVEKVASTTPATVPRIRSREIHGSNYSSATSHQHRTGTEAADEALLARARRAREGFAHAMSNIRPRNRPSSRLSQSSPPQEALQIQSRTQSVEEESDFFAQSRQLRQVMAESINFFQEERKKEEESQSHASSQPRSQHSDGDLGGSGSVTLNNGEWDQNMPKYRNRQSVFVPREMYGKWNGKGRLTSAEQEGRSDGDVSDEPAQSLTNRGGRDSAIKDGLSDGHTRISPSPVGFVRSHTIQDMDDEDSGDGTLTDDDTNDEEDGEEQYLNEDEEYDEEYEDEVEAEYEDGQDEGEYEDEDEEDEDEDEAEGETLPTPSASQFGFLLSASNKAFGSSLPPFDPKGKTGASVEDAFELSD